MNGVAFELLDRGTKSCRGSHQIAAKQTLLGKRGNQTHFPCFVFGLVNSHFRSSAWPYIREECPAVSEGYNVVYQMEICFSPQNSIITFVVSVSCYIWVFFYSRDLLFKILDIFNTLPWIWFYHLVEEGN